MGERTRTPAVLPPPTICDINCFFPPGHDGPHQKWRGDPCDVEDCWRPAVAFEQSGDLTTRRYFCTEHGSAIGGSS